MVDFNTHLNQFDVVLFPFFILGCIYVSPHPGKKH